MSGFLLVPICRDLANAEESSYSSLQIFPQAVDPPPPVINIRLYNRVFINIILSMLYKYNLIDACIHVFLESFGERKFNVSIMLKETMYMIFLSAQWVQSFDPWCWALLKFKTLTPGVDGQPAGHPFITPLLDPRRYSLRGPLVGHDSTFTVTSSLCTEESSRTYCSAHMGLLNWRAYIMGLHLRNYSTRMPTWAYIYKNIQQGCLHRISQGIFFNLD